MPVILFFFHVHIEGIPLIRSDLQMDFLEQAHHLVESHSQVTSGAENNYNLLLDVAVQLNHLGSNAAQNVVIVVHNMRGEDVATT